MKRTRKTDAGDKVQNSSHLKPPHCSSSTLPTSLCGSRSQSNFSSPSFMQKDTKPQVNGKDSTTDSQMNKGIDQQGRVDQKQQLEYLVV